MIGQNNCTVIGHAITELEEEDLKRAVYKLVCVCVCVCAELEDLKRANSGIVACSHQLNFTANLSCGGTVFFILVS